MIPVVTTEQIRECDRFTIEELGIPGVVLMENASRAAAAEAVRMLDNQPTGKHVRIFCGKGNNGGDGFAMARHLGNAGSNIELILLGKAKDLKGDALFNCELFKKLDGKVKEVDQETGFNIEKEKPDLIIDAILGTGFIGPARGLYAEAIEIINSTGVLVLAVDMPSGVEADTGIADGFAVKADSTVTFGLIKAGLLLPPGRECAGRVTIADIGIPPQVVEARNIDQFIVELNDVKQHLPRRHPADHKGKAGHVFIIAGSPGMTGAAVLAAEASMRTGTGLTVVGVPQSLNPVLEMKLTEAMTLPLAENKQGSLNADAYEQCCEKIEWASVVAFGPGIGRNKDTAKLLERLLEDIDKPLVIDADGLNLLADNPGLLNKLPENTVLTPHPGEFSRLTGVSNRDISADRIAIARKWAVKWGITVVLKGSPSLTALPNGNVYINPTGNAGMATGGSGDVLTGIIASLIAQGLNVESAAWMGCYLHGAAGDNASAELGKLGMVAGDIINFLPKVIDNIGDY
ncbi:MAG: NAD(P)H-hydrate dehydratase [Candidatus Hatepunaea meridiana]|nr:NAD(P)H-hydrate dehydratase [Candidatus Hatepunaea meridiana]